MISKSGNVWFIHVQTRGILILFSTLKFLFFLYFSNKFHKKTVYFNYFKEILIKMPDGIKYLLSAPGRQRFVAIFGKRIS